MGALHVGDLAPAQQRHNRGDLPLPRIAGSRRACEEIRQVDAERVGDLDEALDRGQLGAVLQARDGRLRRADTLGELLLGEPGLAAKGGDAAGGRYRK